MRKAVCFLIICLLTALRLTAAPDFSQYFQHKDGCFILYDLKADKTIYHYNEPRCALRVAPCSTFKVAIALMGFDRGVLQDEHTTYRWDGVDRGLPAWNRDTSAADWMKNSVVWYSQRVTPQLGAVNITNYLAKFDYGNQDISGGLTNFWLGSSLKISPDEQLRFLTKLWRGQLPVSAQAADLTKKIMILQTNSAAVVLSGKTGSHVEGKKVLGWFVGHLGGPTGEYLFVTNYGTDEAQPGETHPGGTAAEITRKILGGLQLF